MLTQDVFDRTYITSSEVRKRLGVTRPRISQAIKSGILPKPIMVGNNIIALWERDNVEPIIVTWEKERSIRGQKT